MDTAESKTDPVNILVMIADDDSDTRDLLRLTVKQRKYTVIEVADGQEMIAKAEEQKPDLIVADIMMPRVDGYEGIKKLKENPAFLDTPVIFISCIVTGEALVSQLKKMPNCMFLEKPFDHKVLLMEIDRLLGQQ